MVQTPRFTSNSTLNIKLHTSHHTTPIKLATTLHHQTEPATTIPCGHDPREMDGETARFPAKTGKERGRTLPIVLRCLNNISLDFRPDVKNNRPVTLTSQKACPLPRLAERAEARPEGAWSRKRGGPKGRGPALQKGCADKLKERDVGVLTLLQ